ncbi:putative disease resistance protein At4g19050 isoform X1 [Cucurbita moschata]|uniref:Disease resistance protein At4g19050 isoform X1 n=1 Tax=Cucurbita moschata TaxID=3662 RepID=A0A6J1E870_CUCMO|nr:putative disease resistance protein At4g19050 isoform X1 [Cucurbita moschata]
MNSETGQASAVVSSAQLSEMVVDQVKNNPKFQKTAEIILQNCGNIPAMNLFIAETLNNIAEGEGDDWTLERALEEMASYCIIGRTLEDRIISLMRCGFEMLPRSDLALINCCWHSRQFFRKNHGVHYNVLITNWILEECFGLIDHFEKAYNQGYRILMKLIKCGLLKIENDNIVVMEKLARDVPDSRYHGFIWKPSLGLSGVYEGKNWLGLESVGHADGMIRTCEKDWKEISVLLVDGNHLCQEVIETYFSTLMNLRVLAVFSPRIKSLPISLTKLGNLCFLVLKDCDLLEKIDGLESLKALTVLEISNAKSLKHVPSDLFKSLSKLRSLNLSETGIERLPSSLSTLRELRSINLRGCCCLTSLPMLAKLRKLQLLDVSGATSLESFADKSINALQDLLLLDLSQTLVGHVPFLKDLKQLSRVSYRDCKKLIRLPNLRELSGLEVLDLSGALKIKEIQDNTFPENNVLKILDLSKTGVSCLPSSIRYLSNLELLNLSEMLNMVELEDDTFQNMARLRHLNLSKSPVENLPSLSGLANLRELKLHECSKLRTLPSLIALEKLEVLDISGCIFFEAFEDESFSHMTNLQLLDVSETKIEKMPGLSGLENLSQLLLRNCINLTKFPPLSSTKLKELDVCGAKNLREWEAELPEYMNQLEILNLSATRLRSPPLNNYTNLRELYLRDCELQMPLKLDNLTNLEVLDLSRTRISSLQTITRLCNLRQLLLTDCSDLHEIPTLEPLVKLEALHLQGTGIKKFPCRMAMVTRLMHLDLPDSADTLGLDWTGIKSLPGELNWDQCGMPSQLQNITNRPFMIVRNLESFRIMKGIPDLWNSCFNKFFISVCPLKKGEEEEDKEIYELQDGTSFQDIYFHVMSYHVEYTPFLEIRGFESFPTGLEDALMKVEYVSLVENGFIRSLSELGNANNLKGCWIWSCPNLENLMQEDKDNLNLSKNLDQDNLKFSENLDKDNLKLSENLDKDAKLLDNLEFLWISNLPILRSVHSTGRQFESVRNLKQLYVDACPQLETLFKSSQLSKNLEILHVKFCDRLKSICEPKEGCTLQKLHSLSLVELPELTDIGLKLPSLRAANIRNCPKLGENSHEQFGLKVTVEGDLTREKWDGSQIDNGAATSPRSL